VALLYMATRLFVNLSQAYMPLFIQVHSTTNDEEVLSSTRVNFVISCITVVLPVVSFWVKMFPKR
jgi:hypothetical protein